MTNTINDRLARARQARIAIEAHSPGSSADMRERFNHLMADLVHLADAMGLSFEDFVEAASEDYQASWEKPVEAPPPVPVYVTYSLATGAEIGRGYVCAQVTDLTILAAKSGELSAKFRGGCTDGIYFETLLFYVPPPQDALLYQTAMTGAFINRSYVAFPPHT